MPSWLLRVTDHAAAIALLAGHAGKRCQLAQVLAEFGYAVVFADDPAGLTASELEQVSTDAWLLELAEESPLADWLLEHSSAPVLLGAGEIPKQDSEDYPRWQRRLYGKLLPLLGEPPGGQAPVLPAPLLPAARPQQAPCVWVLGASLGGPAAVKQFLDCLPADLPVAFIYAQHIDGNFTDVLTRVLVAPIARSLGFGADGEVLLSDAPWPGPYRPSIAAVLDAVCDGFGPACGAIIFSGMGEDGVEACGRMRRQGIEVWTQDTASAACATMPGAVQAAGFSHRQGTPEQLAQALQHWLRQEWSALAG